MEDAGMYTVTARNIAGSVSTSSLLVVSHGLRQLLMFFFLFSYIKRLKLCIALHGKPISELRGVTWRTVRDHTVLPATRHKWTRPALTPARQTDTRFAYSEWMEGWVDLGSLIAAWPGIEPTTAWSQVRRPNRYATESPKRIDTVERALLCDWRSSIVYRIEYRSDAFLMYSWSGGLELSPFGPS